jgi:enoyl-CoA hydratase
MDTENVLLKDKTGRVLTLIFNRPSKLNALSSQLVQALTKALDDCELDPTVRVIILTGSGRAFSAGADISAFQTHVAKGPDAAVYHFMRPGQILTRRIESFRKPIIAMVNGFAYGGGCEITEASHLAIASSQASFSKAEIDIGIIPTFGGTQRLPRNVGRKAALELLLTGRKFDANEALRLGLVNKVVEPDLLLQTTQTLARLLAEKSELALGAMLQAVHRGMDASIDDGLAIEEAAFRTVVAGKDASEGIAAFLEKRKPSYSRM